MTMMFMYNYCNIIVFWQRL